MLGSILTRKREWIVMAAGKVLIADNELPHARVIGLNLRMSGYEVDVVGDGAAAVQRAREWQPHLLIVDLLMPRLDGYDVIRELKTRPDTEGIPVLMLTGLRSDQVGNMPHTHEPDWFMTKPFELDQLESAVAQLVARGVPGRN